MDQESAFALEVAAPVIAGGDGEEGLELHFVVHFKGDGLRCVTAAFSDVALGLVPEGAGLASAGGGLSAHDWCGGWFERRNMASDVRFAQGRISLRNSLNRQKINVLRLILICQLEREGNGSLNGG